MTKFIAALARFKKAVAGFVAPAIPLLAIAVLDASPGGSDITQKELIEMIVVCLVAAFGVAVAPANATKQERPKAEASAPENDSESEEDEGYELEQEPEEPLNEE